MSRRLNISTVVLISILVFFTAFIPVNHKRILSRGIDSFETHKPLFGSYVVNETIELTKPLQGIGAIIVPLTRNKNIPDVQIAILNPTTHEPITDVVIPADRIKDDEFAVIEFNEPLEPIHNQLVLRFSALTANGENALGVRFDPRNEKLAVAVLEKKPLWHVLFLTLQQNQEKASLISISLAVAGLLSFLSLRLRWWIVKPLHAWHTALLIIVLLIALAVGIRLILLTEIYGVSGGDPYNYLSITNKITKLHNPFDGEKRLPGYPIVLLPGWLSPIDDIWFMKFISTVSAGGILLMLFLLAQRLGLPWSVQLLAPALLAFQKDFLYISLRPEPYTFYSLLLITALYLFWGLTKRWEQILLGVVLGYAAMTRQEGFVLAAVLMMCLLLQWKKLWWRGYLFIGLPAFLVVLPFLLHNQMAYGNPIFTPYFEGDRLQIVDSPGALKDALHATWGIFGSFWKPSWSNLTRIPFNHPLLLLATSVTTLWWLIRIRWSIWSSQWGSVCMLGISTAVLGTSIWLFVKTPLIFGDVIMVTASGILLGSILPFIYYTRLKSIPILLVITSQILIAAWFHPFTKHYQQNFALIALMIATAIIMPRSTPYIPSLTSTISGWVYRMALLFPLFIIVGMLLTTHTTFFDRLNERTAQDWVLYRAVRSVQNSPQPLGFDQPYQPARLYFEDQAHYFFGDEHSSATEKRAWIKENKIRTWVVTNDTTNFIEPDPSWKEILRFKAAGQDEKIMQSVVYEIPQP